MKRKHISWQKLAIKDNHAQANFSPQRNTDPKSDDVLKLPFAKIKV